MGFLDKNSLQNKSVPAIKTQQYTEIRAKLMENPQIHPNIWGDKSLFSSAVSFVIQLVKDQSTLG